jgi:hypothetical protein
MGNRGLRKLIGHHGGTLDNSTGSQRRDSTDGSCQRSQCHVGLRDSQAAAQAALMATVRCREPVVIGGYVTWLPHDSTLRSRTVGWARFEGSAWPETQAGLLVRHFHDWQRVRPRHQSRARDRGRPTRPVVGRYLVRVEEGDGCCCLHG